MFAKQANLCPVDKENLNIQLNDCRGCTLLSAITTTITK